ncbi:MAG: phosphatase PAP2 family protein [Acidobacteria bacterium]|nr:phosphatase PAP2 family protein [Acidobacteriota bacterium]
MTNRAGTLPRVLFGIGLLAVAFLLDHWAFGFFRTVTFYDHWGEMREGLTAAKFLASGLGTLVVGLTIAFLDRRHWRRAAAFWLVILLAAAVGSVIKVGAGRERPSRSDQVPGHERTVFHGPALGLRHASCQSFPSGHTLSAFASATVLSAFYPGAAPVFFAVATATGVNRIVTHQHFLSDVVAGALLGHLLALLLLRWWWIRRLWAPDGREAFNS